MRSRRAPAEAEDRRQRELRKITAGLAMPGVTVFDAGLFSQSTRLTPGGATVLTELGRRLGRLGGQITVVGHAVAVPRGPTSGGSPVALARAQITVSRLAAGGKLPLTAFTLTTADQRAGPFPTRRTTAR